MQARSAGIREASRSFPDSAALHPGYMMATNGGGGIRQGGSRGWIFAGTIARRYDESSRAKEGSDHENGR
jgi:hypothetical protein